MKLFLYYPVFIVFLFFILSCAVTEKTTSIGTDESAIDINTLNQESVLAFLTLEKAKLNALDSLQSFPYTKKSKNTVINLKNTTDYSNFRTKKIKFTDNTVTSEGIHKLGLVCLSVDDYGRRDLSKNKIVFRTSKPKPEENSIIQKSLTKQSQFIQKLQNSELRRILKNIVKDYQEANSLAVDGIIGKNTIKALAEDALIIDIVELHTQVLYPEEPAFQAFILEANDLHTYQFDSGFESIDTVRNNALSLQELKHMANPEKEFVMCIYFFDRLNPSYGLSWGFSNHPEDWAENMSSVGYAKPETWPLLIESFTISPEQLKDLAETRLYVHIYRKIEGFFGLNKHIGSCAIQ